MTLSRASETARRTATYRADHQHDPVRILDDPFAIRLLGDDAEAIDWRPELQPAKLYIAARARFAEDRLARAVAAGVRRYVVLGAGLDTFALRNPHPDVEVIEVDHPATQAWKRDRYARAGLALPACLRLVAVDFAVEDLGQRLRQEAVVSDTPTFFSWLGVSYYLSRAAVVSTLQAIAGQGAEVVLDFYLPPTALSARSRERLLGVAARVAALGEPFVSYFEHGDMKSLLRAAGFARADTFGGMNVVADYLGVPAPEDPGFTCLAHATS